MSKLDATRIFDRLYQGAFPPKGLTLRKLGFDILVLSAIEKQPPDQDFPGVQVLRCALRDDGTPLTMLEWNMAATCAARVAELHRRGAKILITCAMGRNRSGLITALALALLTGRTPAQCAGHVRLMRRNALTNDYFNAALRNAHIET